MESKTHLSSSNIIDKGWIKKGTERIDGGYITTYKKGLDTLTYNGEKWLLVKFPDSFSFSPEHGLTTNPIKITFTNELK